MTSVALPRAGAPAAGALPPWAAGLMALASGALLTQACSLHPAWWAAWAAPVPLIAAVLAGPSGRARWLGASAGLGAGASLFPYIAFVAGWPTALALLLGRILFWSALAAMTARAARVLPAWLAALIPALFAAGLDTLVAALSPHGTYGSMAYSQMDALPVIQVAALGGAPAIVFLVLYGGSAAGLCVGRLMGAPIGNRSLALTALVAVAVIGAALAWGAARLGGSAPPATLRVSLIAGDQFAAEPRDWGIVWSAYGPAVEAAARPGVAVVLPEKIALLTEDQAREAGAEIAGLARRRQATILVGIEVKTAAGAYANRALVATPEGDLRTYDKRRPVPGREGRDRPGQGLLRFAIGGAQAGAAICKDMHFPAIGRENGLAGAGVMLVPAWDFGRDGWMSDRLTALRGVESGFAVVRSTREGISSVTDRFGRVLAERGSGARIATLTAEAPIEHVGTLYQVTGDAFGWACLAASILLLLARRDRPKGG